MPNVESEITESNFKTIEESKIQNKNETTCNCKIITSFPVEGKCLSKSVIYKTLLSLIITKNSIILDPPQDTLKQDTTKICIAAEIKI